MSCCHYCLVGGSIQTAADADGDDELLSLKEHQSDSDYENLPTMSWNFSCFMCHTGNPGVFTSE